VDIKTIYTIIHLIGVAIGAGGAFAADYIFFQSIKDQKITSTEMNFIENSSKMVWFGLLILVVSGLGLFTENPEEYISSSKFISKMIVVLIIAINGIFFHVTHTPRLKQSMYRNLKDHFKEKRNFFILSGALSGVSWLYVIILGSLRSIPYSVTEALVIYIVFVLIAFGGALLLSRKYF
jgi:uncharacterized membrane protein